MESQASRLLGLRGGGHGRRGGGQREELIEAHGFDVKFAMHAARLGFQGLELLATGKLNLPIQGEPADWLRAVRRGDISFDEWWNRSLELDAQLEAMAQDDSIPPGPDRPRTASGIVDVHHRDWRGLYPCG
jgi:hypothetical protein